tara:strand:+ start:4730 stop:5590 length:861 start_codon:yes stop_codon:yes gene_type:complete
MIRFIISLIIILLLFKSVTGNDNFKFSYTGTIVIDEKPLSFNIYFNKKKGIVDGYSLTNLDNQNETKSKLTGIYFKSDKSYQLIETGIIQTKSKIDTNSFCFIKMELFEKGKFRNKRLEGNFTASLKNDSVCAEGKVFLMPKNKIEKKLKKIEKKLKKIEKNLNTSVYKNEKTAILKNGDDHSIYCKNQKIKIEITDADLEDGDKIELKINDIIILDNYTTTKIKKTITYKLINEETYINIKSISDGKSPPNTSVVKIIDGENINPIVAEMKKDQTVKIKLVYKKK